MKTTTAERIRALRKRRKLTQDDLARLTGIAQATISSWESGKNPPSRRLLALLAKALGVKETRII